MGLPRHARARASAVVADLERGAVPRDVDPWVRRARAFESLERVEQKIEEHRLQPLVVSPHPPACGHGHAHLPQAPLEDRERVPQRLARVDRLDPVVQQHQPVDRLGDVADAGHVPGQQTQLFGVGTRRRAARPFVQGFDQQQRG